MVAANNAPEWFTGRQWQMHEISLHSETAFRNCLGYFQHLL